MKISNKKLVEECLERIELLQLHIAAVDSAKAHLSRLKQWQGVRVDSGNLRSELIDSELDEWRKLFMWCLTIEDETRDRIKAAAYQRFLDQRNNVSQWLNPDGVVAGSWLKADEDEFRIMVSKLFSSNN
jgi:nicotinic acid phosphoribosyltransferase